MDQQGQEQEQGRWNNRSARLACSADAVDQPARSGGILPKSRILHVSADFPDPFDTSKTSVIRTLLDLTEEQFGHRVISLNRRSPSLHKFGWDLLARFGKPELKTQTQAFKFGEALVYDAPPLGWYHATMLRELGDQIGDAIGDQYDLVIGHKLTVEGLVVSEISKRIGVPFGVCIQGDTDTKILRARPDLAAAFGRIFHQAEIVFPFTPWALREVEARLGARKGPTMLLPCPTDLDVPLRPKPEGQGIISAFHLKNYRRKNLAGMVAAMQILRQESSVGLSIIGGGTEQDEAHCRRISGQLNTIVFEGRLGRGSIRQRMNEAVGFVLPSLRESFGLVFIEALFAGLPIVYPRGTSIDGYFDDLPFAIAVDARNPSDIAGAIRKIMREELTLKAQLEDWQRSTRAEQFMRSEIAKTFTQGLECAIHR